MIYLDNQATTPLAPEAKQAMIRWLDGADGDTFGNPHSAHKLGRKAWATIEVARENVAALLPSGGRVTFTGSATEALNLAIRGSDAGRARAAMAVSQIEHSAVLNTAKAVSSDLTILPIGPDGYVDPQVALPEGVGLVSVMQVNNEIGTIQPVDAIGERARAAGALFVCDAVQGAGKFAAPKHADMIAIAAHKVYGPKGIGALWVRDGVDVDPQITGGGQEQNLRSGTLSPALIAGFGAAAKLAAERMEQDAAHMDELWDHARELFPDWQINGSQIHRWKGNFNIRRDGVDVARLMSDCRHICFSAGSACASEEGKPSRILGALGLSSAQAKSSIRLGFGRYTTVQELEEAAELINAAVKAQE